MHRVVRSISASNDNPFADRTLFPPRYSSSMNHLIYDLVVNENMYSLSWRPGERSARTLRSSAFMNEPIHTHTHTSCSMMYSQRRVARVERRLPRERELLLSLKGRGGGRRATTAGGGQSSSYSLSLSLFFVSIAELFSSMKGLG